MSDSELLSRLKSNQRRGSKARCHLLTHGEREIVAARLTALIEPYGRAILTDRWLPNGFVDTDEAKLGETAGLLSDEHRKLVTGWWLEVRKGANTPNWDIAGTCMVSDKPGLFLIEAKAHLNELKIEGKSAPGKPNSRKNQERIGGAIAGASEALNRLCGGWDLCRDSHYQLANRFAWSWKVASLGVRVILVYLGFLNAHEMADCGPAIETDAEWRETIHRHCQGIVPVTAWDQEIKVNGMPLVALIRSTRLDLPSP